MLLFRFCHRGAALTHVVEFLLTGVLGAFLLMAGMVKFFEPFRTMFATQIELSGLPFPALARVAGQGGEISAGLLLLAVLLGTRKFTEAQVNTLFTSAVLLALAIMVVAIFVHLSPAVPAAVLPLQTKPPVLTVVIMLLLLLTAYLRRIRLRAE
ncbi:hypothetical protein [Cobetia sp. 1CM21F]|uniref:hypothetical protein n=1 Tax=Cobetia sp. 1CM21F TaxID=2929163 RepID=UPI0020BE4A28|nr:hypothetical protein [Cobetia sp. 1CM21F]MCK8067695.1 hypothetical protein [Cobetia sp. 1CM21F]